MQLARRSGRWQQQIDTLTERDQEAALPASRPTMTRACQNCHLHSHLSTRHERNGPTRIRIVAEETRSGGDGDAPDQSERDRATDISRSVIVQAPAGSGKTTLLVERYLKLLAVVDKPEEILAITFTRKAASEMASRVLEALRSRAVADPRQRARLPRALARSEAMGWQLTRYPSRLKIQTIDSLACLSDPRLTRRSVALNPGLSLTENAEPHYARAASQACC